MERALIGEYEKTVEALLAGLTRDNHGLAVEDRLAAGVDPRLRPHQGEKRGRRAREAGRAAAALPGRAGRAAA